MQLSEKRQFYKCGKNFKKESELALWPAVWKVMKPQLEIKGTDKYHLCLVLILLFTAMFGHSKACKKWILPCY